LSGVGALWNCVPRVCSGEGGCAGGGVPLACPGVVRCLSGVYIIMVAVTSVAPDMKRQRDTRSVR